MGIFLQGVQVHDVTTAAGQVVSRSYTVSVASGQLVLGLKDLGGVDPNVCIEAMSLTSVVVVPTAPAGLAAAAASASQINLSWQNNSTGALGFMLERETGTSGTWTQIATLAAGTTSYQDTSLAANTSYSYRLCAYSTAGDSAYSAAVAGTTLMTVPAAPSGPVGKRDLHQPSQPLLAEQCHQCAGFYHPAGDRRQRRVDADRHGRGRHDELSGRLLGRQHELFLPRVCLQQRRRFGLLQR